MKSFFDRWREETRRFMIGRYGPDELSRFLLGIVFVLIAVNLFLPHGAPLVILEMLLLVFCYYRILSKDSNRRFQENQKYLTWKFHVTEWFKNLKFRAKEGNKYKIFKCPNCGQKIRIPRGHGKISIHCRKCGHDFLGRS